MSSVEKAYETQISNIQAKTGKSLEELGKIAQESGLTKHSELRSMFQEKLDLGYGDANTLVHYLFKSDGESAAKAKGATTQDILSEIYTGAKAALRPIHEQLMTEIGNFGEFEVAPKKGYVSLRRKKQFAMIGPATNTRLEVGLNVKGLPSNERLIEQPAGSMCNYKVRLTEVDQVDQELIAWIKRAYEGSI
jgi:hypothetical protein